MQKLNRTWLSVKELTDMYRDGEIAIPEIQRDFVWDAKRIRLLIDSVQKDYPSGAIILWRPHFRVRSEFEMLIRPERLHLYKKRLPTYLLLDGQQRLTALGSVVLPADQVMDSLGEEIELPNLFINPKTLGIEARKDIVQSSNGEVLLNRLLSVETDDSGMSCVMSELAARRDITTKHRNGLREFRDRVLLYTYPVQILEKLDYKTVADIFKRVNSQGKILLSAEIELATIVPHWNGVSKHLRVFIKEMRQDGFTADLPFYMKCLAFIASDSPVLRSFSKGIADGDYSKPRLESCWRTTKKSIRRLHAVLQRNKINRTELITTRNALVPIVYAISRDKRHKITDDLIVRWLIYTMVGNHYTQQTEGVLRRDSYVLTDSSSGIEKRFAKLYRRMLKADISETKFDDSDFWGVQSKNPAMLCMYLGLCHNGAKDFCGKKTIGIDQIGEYQVHHIFPIEFMLEDEDAERYRKRKGLTRAEFKEQINDVANLTIISLKCNQEIKKRPPFDYLPKLTTQQNIQAHCIPTNPELWKPQNFDKFSRERRRLLGKAMNSYLKNLK